MAKQLGNIAVGKTLYLNENGIRTPYIVVHQGLPSSLYSSSCSGTWLLRNSTFARTSWSIINNGQYNTSNINDVLNSTFLNVFSDDIQNAIKTVKIPYTAGNSVASGENGLETKVFLLSIKETGITNGAYTIPNDGAALSYFNPYNVDNFAPFGSGDCWTRSAPDNSGGGVDNAYCFYSNGSFSIAPSATTLAYTPAFIMPTNLIVDDNNNITSSVVPTAPSSITVPTSSIPAGSTISVSWSTVPNATSYILQRSVNGGNWQTVQNNSNTSFDDVAGAWTQVQYRVASSNSGFNSAYLTSSIVTVLPYTIDTLTVPSQIMEGQNIPISWSAVSLATNYILERNPDSSGWEQIYSGSSTNYTDTPGVWTEVQYRVKAGANNVYGAYNTSAAIPVISASALVISGTDSDLGTLTSDVPYTVSTDTGNPITLTRKVNGILVSTLTVQSGFAYSIPVMDLPTGSGTIEIDASVNTSGGGPVSATRTWTYTKTAITFPGTGGVSQLTLNGQNVFPITLQETVRVPAVWGGSLDKALELLLPVVNAAVISVGTYEGTGTFGADNPNILTFEDTPVVVTIYGGGQTLVISSTDTSSSAYISGNQAKWYSTVSAAEQMNTAGVTYSYVAVAKGVTA